MGKKVKNSEASLRVSNKNYDRFKKFYEVFEDNQDTVLGKILDKAEEHKDKCEKVK